MKSELMLQGMAWQGAAWFVMARHGEAWQGGVRYGIAGFL